MTGTVHLPVIMLPKGRLAAWIVFCSSLYKEGIGDVSERQTATKEQLYI